MLNQVIVLPLYASLKSKDTTDLACQLAGYSTIFSLTHPHVSTEQPVWAFFLIVPQKLYI